MFKFAAKFITGDKTKYYGLILGVAFATLLISQQVSIFIGLMTRTASIVYTVSEPDLWVMDPRVRYIEEVEPLRDIELTNVRSVPGVEWAVPFYKGLATIRMPDGLSQQVQLIGIDDVSLIGIAPKILMGDSRTLQRPDNAMMDLNGFHFTWPGEPLKLGKFVELNDHRLLINGICEMGSTFYTFPVLYVSYNTAKQILPPQRNLMSFVLVKAKQGVNLNDLKTRISEQTRLQAMTQKEFAWCSIQYILTRTGIAINFGMTIFLGLLIGISITALTFYIFIIDHLKHFGTMKAIGMTNRQLTKLVLIQTSLVGLIGYALGISMTALFFYLASNLSAFQDFFLRWQVMVGCFFMIGLIIVISSFTTLRKIFKLDPAIVFRE